MEGASCGGGDAIDGEGPVCVRGVAVGGAVFWGISGTMMRITRKITRKLRAASQK